MNGEEEMAESEALHHRWWLTLHADQPMTYRIITSGKDGTFPIWRMKARPFPDRKPPHAFSFAINRFIDALVPDGH